MKREFKEIKLSEFEEPKEKKETTESVNENLRPSDTINLGDGKEKLKQNVDDILKEFENNKATFESENPEASKNVVNNDIVTNDKSFLTPEFATNIVLRLGNIVLTGLNVHLLNMFSKTKIEFDELKLSDSELEDFSFYAEPVAAKILKVLPAWAIALIHVEMTYVFKFNQLVKIKKDEKQNSKN